MKNLIIIYLFPIFINGQNEVNFDTFDGISIFIPTNELQLGYGDHLFNNKVLNKVKYNTLNIPQQNVKISFPGVSRRSQFGLLLNSKLKVYEEGCYEISLDSDDGSKLWLNKQIIIDNDSVHKMTKTIDTIWLNKGMYKTKLWYYNAFPEEYGLILSQRKLPNVQECNKDFSNSTTPAPLISDREYIELSDTFLFASASYTLNYIQLKELDEIIDKFSKRYISEIIIEGNTDEIGNDKYNDVLSKQRAESVFNYLSIYLNLDNTKVTLLSHGERNAGLNKGEIPNRKRKRNVHIYIRS